jgi:GDPmannose 4,6-dehydratase
MTSYLITGVTGQIGSYAAEQLVAAGHTVYGMVRGQKTPNLPEGVVMVRGDLADSMSLRSAIMKSDPEVVFNFGAVTAIGMSWDWPLLTADVTGMGVLRLLEACRQWNRNIRVVQASTADQFGNVLTHACTTATLTACTSARPFSSTARHRVMATSSWYAR